MRGATLLRLVQAASRPSSELATAQQIFRSFTAIPAGHRNSDLREEVCNVGLNRRRDLMMRGDIKLDTTAGTKTLRELLKVGLLKYRATQLNHIIRKHPQATHNT